MDSSHRNSMNKLAETTGTLEFPIKLLTIHSNDLQLMTESFHWHDELQILYIEEGSIDLYLENEHIRISKGNSLMINQKVMHYFRFTDDHSKVQLFLFHPAFLFGSYNAAMNAKYLAPILGNKDHLYYVLDQTDGYQWECLSHVKELIEVNKKQEYGYELTTKALLCNLWLALLKQHMQSDQVSPKIHTAVPNNRVRTAILYIEDHYTEAVTLDEIANSIHVSKSECCRSFKRALNMTPFEYLMKYRIYIASVKIASGDPLASSISGLAANVGFNNPSYFNKVFKEFIGCTPTQYRKDLDKYNVLSLLPTQPIEDFD